ncbi:MAG TPA: inositol monophosphatase family protein, partial [Gemmatimonadales bacterium]|nr:inositol monophosphatase family protein [Gemmatimonadales bacterium]
MTEPSGDFRRETLVAVEAVTRAFTIARRGVAPEDVAAKGGRDLVTAADVAVEDAVRGVVADALGFAVIGEERGGQTPAATAPYWLVDPKTYSAWPGVAFAASMVRCL